MEEQGVFSGLWTQTFAGLSVGLQAVSSGTGAQVAALRVLTQEVTGLGGQRALVHVCRQGKQNTQASEGRVAAGEVRSGRRRG